MDKTTTITAPPPFTRDPLPLQNPGWSPADVDASEAAVFAALAPSLRYTKRSIPVLSGTTPSFMNTISAGPPSAPPLVLLHGWGSGAALFARNLPSLAASHRVHAVDWLGFGASARPPFDLSASPEAAEGFFLDALEQWVDAMRSSNEPDALGPRFHLVGHSLGAFLAVGFALRRPAEVVNLVLASPVGVPRAPLDKYPPRSAPLAKRALFWVCFALWERHWTPQALVRNSPTAGVGRTLAAWVMGPRFPTNDAAARAAMDEYFYQSCLGPPSGEHSLSTVLESGAYARRPLEDKLPNVRMSTLFLYGTRDWMDWTGGERVRKSMPVETDLVRVEGAGHHLYYDNPEDFGKYVDAACAAARAREGQ
jgi:pimeloyl-ACP methyl ester carboxylesterase